MVCCAKLWSLCSSWYFPNTSRSLDLAAGAYQGTGGQDVRPTDAGGPIKEFFSDVWKQLESLKFCPRNSTIEVPLFTNEGYGCLPATKEKMEEPFITLGISPKDSRTEINAYFEAVGRLMAHAMMNNILIPTTVLTPLYRAGMCKLDIEITFKLPIAAPHLSFCFAAASDL